MRLLLTQLRELEKQQTLMKESISKEIQERYPLVDTININTYSIYIYSEAVNGHYTSYSDIKIDVSCPTSPPETAEDFLAYKDGIDKQRHQVLSALYYMKFREALNAN